MPHNTRSSSSQEDILTVFLRSNEFRMILKETVKEETSILIEKINELKEEVRVLKKSNIDMIKLLTDNKKLEIPKVSKKENDKRIMIKKTYETSGNVNKTTISLCSREENEERKISENEEAYLDTNENTTGRINNSDWTTVKRRRENDSRKYNGIIGKDITNGNLKAVERKVQIYISRVHTDTTLNDLKEFLKEKFPEAECEQSRSKYPEHYSSFKITINENHYNLIMDPDLWPQGIYINKFFRSKFTKPSTN